MAIGDAAIAAGMDLVPGSLPAKDIDDAVNGALDYIAAFGITPGSALSIARGGTGATTVPAARTALGLPTAGSAVLATPDTLVQRYGDGVIDAVQFATANDPALPNHCTRRSWVESYVSSRLAGIAPSTLAEGPTTSAYNRSSTGGGWFAVWMNNSNQFMRNTSSLRYKENVRDWAPGDFMALRPVIFDRKGDETPDNEVGFIAEEVLEAVPEAVVYFNDKIDGITDRAIIAALVSHVQALTRRVEELEAG